MYTSSKQSNKCNIISADVCIDKILTQRTCADIVVEIIKLLTHQKLQIPYKYEVLKYLVEKKKESDKERQDSSWQSKKHYHTVSTALNVLDNIFKNLISEMESGEPPEEVYVVLGATPTSPKEVFRIVLPDNLHVHYHHNHLQTSRHVVLNTLRKITTSSDLSKTVFRPIQTTNMYILLNRRRKTDDALDGHTRAFSEFFHPVHNLKISPKITQTIINLKYTTPSDTNCCDQMIIFEDFTIKCNVSGGDDVASSCVSDVVSSTNSNVSDFKKHKDTISPSDGEDNFHVCCVESDEVMTTNNISDVTARDSVNLIHNNEISIARNKNCSNNINVYLSSDDGDGKSHNDDGVLPNDDGGLHNDDGNLPNDEGDLKNDEGGLQNGEGGSHNDEVDLHIDNGSIDKSHNKGDNLHDDDDGLHIENVKVTTDYLVHEDRNWYQASLVLKGFKDCFINGKSISNSWCS